MECGALPDGEDHVEVEKELEEVGEERGDEGDNEKRPAFEIPAFEHEFGRVRCDRWLRWHRVRA